MFPRPVILSLLAAGLLLPRAAASQPLPEGDGPLVRALRESMLARKAAAPAPSDASPVVVGAGSPFAAGRTTARPPLPPLARIEPPPALASTSSPKSPVTNGISGDGYGFAMSPLGDAFNDGFSDYVVGAPWYLNALGNRGAVFIYNATGAGVGSPQILLSKQDGNGFGFSVAGVGDVNGDGYNDLLVGAPYQTVNGHTYCGQAFLFLGASYGYNTAPAWSFTTEEDLAHVGASVAWAGDVNRDGYDDWILGAPYHSNGEASEGAAYLFLGGSGGLSGVPAWTQESDRVGAYFGYSVASAGDVNGDGYADLLVGSPEEADGPNGEGVVHLFTGGPSGPTHVPARRFLGGVGGALLGYSVAPAGDVNGDGYADFLAGAPQYTDDQSFEGVAMLYYGGPVPALIAPPQFVEGSIANAYFGACVATAGDVNGDGYADVIVSATSVPQVQGTGAAYVYLGSASGLLAFLWDEIDASVVSSTLGFSVCTFGDTNGDGRSEYAAGEPAPSGSAVNIRAGQVYYTESPVVAAQGYDTNGYAGSSAATADVDGDGYDDLIVGTPSGGGDSSGRGSLTLYRGGPRPFQPVGPYPFLGAAPDWTYAGGVPNEGVGQALSNAGDVNADGYEDFITGSIFFSDPDNNEGEALLFFGSPSGPLGSPVWQNEGNKINALYGWAVGGGGDLNGDGYDDVAVSAPQEEVLDQLEGSVSVYQGSALGLAHVPVVRLRGGQPGVLFGVGCAIVGDVNRDGYDDLVVGAPFLSDPENEEGALFLYYGSPTGVHEPAAQQIQIDVANAQFGWFVARIGDVNGDGYADVAVGAPHYENGQANEGAVFVYYGSPGGLITPASWKLEADIPGIVLGSLAIGGAGDVDADGYSDLYVGWPNLPLGGPFAGGYMVFRGGPGGLDTAPLYAIPSGTPSEQLGYAGGGMADFNGDGVSDMYFTSPGFGLYAANEGVTWVRFGNTFGVDTRNPDRPGAAWRTDGAAPISAGLRSNSTTGFNLHAKGRLPTGRTRLKLEYEVKPLDVAFNFLGRGSTAWQPSGPVVPFDGTTVAFNAPVTGLTPASRYHWRARYRSKSPLFPASPWFGSERVGARERMVVTAGGALPVGVDPGAPAGLALSPATPNPFTRTATISFTLPRGGHATLALYDVRGALVRTIFDGNAAAGTTPATWNGMDANGHAVPAGAYFTRLTFEGEQRLGKVVRLP